MVKGDIFQIQKFCLQDGPGIRTTVFLKGCPLHCLWCHNPECHLSDSELAEVSDWKSKEMTVNEVLQEVMKDSVFYQTSGGGLTLSGGEPLSQIDFLLALCKGAKKMHLHICLETCGFAPQKKIEALFPFIDLFLYDWKISDPQLHQKYTGADNQIIRENLSYLDSKQADIILRCPIIPNLNDTEDHFQTIAKLTSQFPHIREIHLEPYHALGVNKLEKLQKASCKFTVPTEQEVMQWLQRLQTLTKTPVKYL